MATAVLPGNLEQEIVRLSRGRSMESVVNEAVVNLLWDDEQEDRSKQVTDPELAITALMRRSGNTREQVVRNALVEWVGDYQDGEIAVQRMKDYEKDRREGRDTSTSLEQWMDELGMER